MRLAGDRTGDDSAIVRGVTGNVVSILQRDRAEGAENAATKHAIRAPTGVVGYRAVA